MLILLCVQKNWAIRRLNSGDKKIACKKKEKKKEIKEIFKNLTFKNLNQYFPDSLKNTLEYLCSELSSRRHLRLNRRMYTDRYTDTHNFDFAFIAY